MDLRDVMAGTVREGTKVPLPGQNQNLIEQNKVSGTGGMPGFWRAAVLDLLSILSAFFFGYAYFRHVTTGLSLWYLFVLFLIFAASSVLQVFLGKSVGRRTLVVIAEAIGIVAPFVFFESITIVVIAGAIVFIFLFSGYLWSRSAMQNAMEVQFFGVTRNATGKIVSAVILAMLILYIPQAQGAGLFIPQGSFNVLFNWTAGLMSNFYPGIPFTDSFGNFATAYVTTRLQSEPSFTSLTSAQQSAAVTQAATALSVSVTQATGKAPTADKPVSNVAYDYLVAVIAALKNKLQDQFVIWWIVILFVILRTVGVLAVWIAQLASLVVYEVLLASGFMRIAETTQTKETVVYSYRAHSPMALAWG